MKYEAEDVRINDEHYASVTAGRATTGESQSLRHARAMKAVLLAAKAWAKAWEKALEKPEGLRVADRRLVAAQEQLAKIEKEVSRG